MRSIGVEQTGHGSPSRLWIRDPAFAEGEPLGEGLVDRRGQTLDLVLVQVGGECIRRELGAEQDLVRPRATDTRERALIAEERVQPARVGPQDLAESLRSQAERVRPEVRELRLQFVRAVEAHLRTLLRPCLGQDDRATALEREPEGRRLRALGAWLEVAHASGAHQVDVEDELAVVGGEEEVLPAPPRSFEATAFQGGERRVERLQRCDVCRARLFDRVGADQAVERPAERFDLGKLRHRYRLCARSA